MAAAADDDAVREFVAWEAEDVSIPSSWRSLQKMSDAGTDAYYIDTVTEEAETDPPVDEEVCVPSLLQPLAYVSVLSFQLIASTRSHGDMLLMQEIWCTVSNANTLLSVVAGSS